MSEYEQNLQALKEALERGDIQQDQFDFGKAELMKIYGIKEDSQQASDDSNDEPPPISTAVADPKPVTPNVTYQVVINGEKKGAFEFNTVIEKIQSGEYKRDTMLWTKGMKDWVEACELPAFENYFEEEPPEFVPQAKPKKKSSVSIEAKTTGKNIIFKVTKGVVGGFIGKSKVTGKATGDDFVKSKKDKIFLTGNNFKVKILDYVSNNGKNNFSFYLNESNQELRIRVGDELVIEY